MPGALILDGHSRAAVEATQSLGRAGVEVTVCASEAQTVAFGSRHARHKLEQPPPVPVEALIAWLRDIDSRQHYELIIPSTESSLQAFAALPEDDPLRLRAVLPSRRALTIALDRNLTWRLATEVGVPVPAQRLIEALPAPLDASTFPRVLKPVRSKTVEYGELKTFAPVIVRDTVARSSVLQDWVPRMAVLDQEYVPGWGVGVEVLYRNGELLWHFAHERLHEWPLTGGASTYRRAIEPPEGMLAAARRILDALEWHGVAMVEFKRRRDGSFALMEINPRLWGSLALSIAAGVDFPIGLWRLATGAPLPPQARYRRGLRVRHLSTDISWQKANFLANHRDPLLLTRPRLRSLLEPALVLVGRERWDHFRWSDPGPMWRELRQMARTVVSAGQRQRRIQRMLRRRERIIADAIARLAAVSESRAPRLLMLCQANICRSPFAALVARTRLANCRIDSAGFDPRAGRTSPPNVAEEAIRMGIDMSECRSTPVSEDLLRAADLILFMDLKQYDQLCSRFPQHLERAVPLGLFAEPAVVEIEDPNHQDATVTRRILIQIEAAIARLAEALGLGNDLETWPEDPEGVPAGLRRRRS
ncbi:MAG TPA: ATP-grasp domain-containing protein [Steroidobacteraceae bacterium]|nr:ATP-grasp domain-containing protein [Steroidobacteraceae bacterium]